MFRDCEDAALQLAKRLKARKLRAPHQPELAIGAIGEDGEVYLNSFAHEAFGVTETYIRVERDH